MSGACNWDSSEIDWINGSDRWETTCGNSFSFDHDGPTENHFKFCPYCGKELVDLEANVHLRPGTRKAEAIHAS